MGSVVSSVMASGTGSIQRLLKAESEANAKVASARQNKQNLLKKARDDAELEVQNYKQKKEQEFQDYKRNHEADTVSYERQLAQQTNQSVAKTNQEVAVSKEKVIDLILRTISEVHVE